jgi:hypothetical protein
MIQTQLKLPTFFWNFPMVYSQARMVGSLCYKWFDDDDNNNNNNNNNKIFVKSAESTFLQGPIWHRLQLH